MAGRLFFNRGHFTSKCVTYRQAFAIVISIPCPYLTTSEAPSFLLCINVDNPEYCFPLLAIKRCGRNCLNLFCWKKTNFDTWKYQEAQEDENNILPALSKWERAGKSTPRSVFFPFALTFLCFPPCVRFLTGNSSLRNLSLFINAILSVTMAMLKESVTAKQDHKGIIFIFILSSLTNKQINKRL